MKPPLFVILALLAGIAPAWAGSVHSGLPSDVDSESRYLIYLHGKFVETGGQGFSRLYGRTYALDAILEALAGRGFTVIGEQRGTTRPGRYADKVARQVRTLLKAGVPPRNITVAGHSKGGQMTLMTAAIVGNPKVNYAVLAGCAGPGTPLSNFYATLRKRRGKVAKGRLLSLYDRIDRDVTSCAASFDGVQGETHEIVTDTGEGHALFYGPREVWIDPLTEWVKR